MTITYAASARIDLEEIWAYNEKTYGWGHAASYLDFLQDGVQILGTKPDEGKVVEGFSGLLALTLKRRSGGHGHIVIYRVDETKQAIRVLHIYHVAQDIQGRLGREGFR